MSAQHKNKKARKRMPRVTMITMEVTPEQAIVADLGNELLAIVDDINAQWLDYLPEGDLVANLLVQDLEHRVAELLRQHLWAAA